MRDERDWAPVLLPFSQCTFALDATSTFHIMFLGHRFSEGIKLTDKEVIFTSFPGPEVVASER